MGLDNGEVANKDKQLTEPTRNSRSVIYKDTPARQEG